MTAFDNEQALSQLLGLPLRTIGRAFNLLWLSFGKSREVTARKGEIRIVEQWAIHLQCDWIITKSGKWILSSADYYVSPEGINLGDDWATSTSQFDVVASKIRAEFEASPPNVISVVCSDAVAFSLDFDDESQLRVLPIENRPEEAWRLFQPYTDAEHFVVPSDQ